MKAAEVKVAQAKVTELRRAFDEAFAAPQVAARADRQSFLLVRAAGRSFALRVVELAGIHSDRVIVPVPGGAPSLLGLAGVRGAVVPVFDFAALLGLGRAGRGARWIVVARGASPIGLLVDEHTGYVEAASDDLRAREGGGPTSTWLRVEDADLPLVDLGALLGALGAGAGGAR